ncbi:putative protein kinase RLK-Pelle-SD-2b family [Helianthus debilis subsp. tardiflorus]
MSTCSFFFAFFLIFMLSPFGSSYTVHHSTTWTTDYVYNYTDRQPMLFTETNVTRFFCCFFCVASCDFNEQNRASYIFAIFVSGNEFLEKAEVVWSANRDYPVGSNATLNFSAAGGLVLQDVDGRIVWATNTTRKSVAGMNLTDAGNLVLFDDENSVVWQSFDHPTDCLLPGQKLYKDQKLKSSVSLTNWSEGMYSLQVMNEGLFGFVESNPPRAYSSWDVYLYDTIKAEKKYIRYLNGSLSFFIHSSEPSGLSEPYEDIDIPVALSAQYMKLMPDGHLQVFEWQFDSEDWMMVRDLTKDVEECDFPLVCGRNSICSTNQQCSCPGAEYFQPVNNRQPNRGCYEITPLTCNSTQHQHFITLQNVYFNSTADMEEVNVETCKQACLNNCSCKAVFYHYYSNSSSGECLLLSELFTMKTVDPGFITYIIHKRKRDAEMEEEYLDQVPGMPTRFSYEELKTATENFSKRLGQGGFGSVFEGSLKDGSKIAVKCLEGLSHIKKSFLAEVQSIGSIHHVNLVRLRGFCTLKSQRFLVYDFMINGSLDRWIYHGVREHILEWECRKKIILDVAKGLTYLHEDCRQKIVHLDIKPQNILLDNDFNAKVSDFGLSKLIDKSQTEVMTTIKGTPGYIAPEWRSSIITEKLDVYSFGIVLLEIVCGRKVFDRSQPEESWHLLFVFQKGWEQGTLLDMVDKHTEEIYVHNTEAVEMMKLAAWCLQTNFKKRPSMSSVVKVLEGGMNVESNLNYNFTDFGIEEPEVGDEKDFTRLSSSLLSGPR